MCAIGPFRSTEERLLRCGQDRSNPTHPQDISVGFLDGRAYHADIMQDVHKTV